MISMWSDAVLLYLFVKLDTIAKIVGEISGIIILLSMVIYLITSLVKINALPILIAKKIDDLTREKKKTEKAAVIRKHIVDSWLSGLKPLCVAVLISWCFHIMALMLPSSGQVAAIYLGVQAKHSEMAKILGKLPVKYARMLELSANKYVCKQAKSLYGNNLPTDFIDMCNPKQK